MSDDELRAEAARVVAPLIAEHCDACKDPNALTAHAQQAAAMVAALLGSAAMAALVVRRWMMPASTELGGRAYMVITDPVDLDGDLFGLLDDDLRATAGWCVPIEPRYDFPTV